MSILRRLLGINSNTPEVKEAIGFNPTNVELIEGNGVAYGLSYQDNGNGSSKVKLLISPLYQSKTYECSTNISVANEFKDQLSLTLIEDSAEIDKVGVIFPEEGISEEGEKCVKGLSFNTYGIKQSVNTPSVEHLDKRKLQKNINNGSLANVGNSYFQPRAAKVDNGDVIVIAHNLKDQTLVSWYLKSDKSGKFRVLDGKSGVTERKLLKFDNPGQLVLNENMMLYTQMSKRITKENQEVKKTHIFKFDMAKVIQDLRDRKRADEYLLGKKNCQINTAPSLSSEHEISFLQYIEGGNLVAFLAEGRSPNKQTLHLTSLVKNGSKSNFTVCEFADSIKQLYVKNNGQDSFIVTAINEGNITICNHQRFEKPSKVIIIPANSIKTLSDFVNIINGRLTPDIISSSTVAPVTITETVVTSKQASTAAIASTAETDTVKTTKLTTGAVASTSTMNKPSTESTTQTSTVTVKPTAPTTSLEKTTQTVFIIPSTSTKESTTPIFTTTLLPQTTSSPQPTQLAIGPNRAGMIGGSLIGTIGIAGIIGFIAYKCIKKYHGYYNTAHVLELADLESHSNSSNEEIFFTHSRTNSDNNISIQTTYQSETMLNSISVESSSRTRSSSSSSSGGPGS